jgi:hypothetical protein
MLSGVNATVKRSDAGFTYFWRMLYICRRVEVEIKCIAVKIEAMNLRPAVCIPKYKREQQDKCSPKFKAPGFHID